MSIKFLVLGGVFWVRGGGSADFIFMGAGIFLILGRTECLRIFIFVPPGFFFFADLVAGFNLLIFGKKCPEESSGKSLAS